MDIIVAPHGDDEIIGCFSLLTANEKRGIYTGVFYPGDVEPKVRAALTRTLAHVVIVDGIEDPARLCQQYGPVHVHAPDPHFEFHPAHRRWGAIAERLFREGSVARLSLYSVNMQAPYVFEVGNPELKRAYLDTCYPEKADLWRFDWKYFLFEGHCEWHRLEEPTEGISVPKR